MILILADSTDPWATLVHREAQRTGGEVLWVEPSQLLDRVLLHWPVEVEKAIVPGSLTIDGATVLLDELTGIFSRLTWPLPLQLDELSSQDRDYVVKETTAAWMALLSALPCAVVNRPVPGGRPALSAGSSTLQRLVAEQGFLLPSSRCTSSQADAILQFSAWRERVYLKALGADEPGTYLHPRDGVNQVCQVMERQAVSMQSIPAGQRVTVYAAGHDVAATVVQPNEAPGRNVDLPFLPTDRCRSLVRALGLTFAECQFVITPEGRAYCLDVSGAPNYWRCPQEVQQEIVRRLVEHLSEMRSLSIHDSLDGADGRSGAGERLR